MPLKLARRHGSPNWYLRGSVRSFAVDESTGVADKGTAETIRAQREWELLQGSIFGRQAVASFLEAAVSYMEAGGERRFLKPLIDRLGATSLARIDQLMIDATAKELYPHAGNSTLNRQVYTPISAVLKHGAARGLCVHRPIERPRQPPGRIRHLTFDEADRLIAACAKHLRPLVTFLFGTGARLSEALYLDWSQVDLARSHVIFVDTKNGESRGVPLHHKAFTVLAGLKEREGAVFLRSDGKPYKPKRNSGGQIKKGFWGACRRAGIVDFSPHDCRHTWASWHYAANRDLVTMMKLGGWKSERMVLRYAHVNTANLAPSIAALAWGIDGKQDAEGQEKPLATGTS